MITKTELLKKLDDPEYGVEDLILWATSLPDDVPESVPAPGAMQRTGGITILPMPCQPEPAVLEVALRLIESGKCPAIPRQARDMAFNLIESIRAEEARRAGK